ncbi:glycerophosphodiester phosphodiesterase [Leifsonia sp. Root112D2]|nr:glycerophosphodiester phosphodiesterase [Leifsonia sp. Root112D2]
MSRTPPAPRPGRFFAPGGPRVFAHRGLAIDAPENTLLAFRRAIAAGATHLETDVHASRDGIAVISHDPDLSRLVGHDARVEDLSMAELRAIDLGFDQPFCSLEEALEALPDALFNIDVKTERAERPTAVAIAAAAATDRVLITSFSEARRRRTADALTGVATSASVVRFLPAVLAAKMGLSPLVRRALRGLDAVQVPERRGAFRIVSPRTVRAMHAAGVEVHVWTVNDPLDMGRLLDWGVDGLVTDRCDLAVEVIRSRS